MGTREQELFDGEPVIQFDNEGDRRNFLKYAGMVGVGGLMALGGVACDDGGDTVTPTDGATAAAPTESQEPTVEATDDADAGAQVPESDLGILNYALTLEFLEADFYKRGIQAKAVSGREMELIKAIGGHEAAHVQALMQTIEDLGGKPVSAPGTKYPAGTFDSRDKFLATASTFEELGVTAYHGQVTKVKTPDILGAAAAIAGVESRHAAVLAKMIGNPPFPAPLEKSQSMQQVLKAAQPFIKG